jgi:hypothetical protein
LIIPKKIFKDTEKISLFFSNASTNESVIMNVNPSGNSNQVNQIDGYQTTFKCAISINKYAFKEYGDCFVYDGRKINRFIKCRAEGITPDDIHIFTHDADDVVSKIPTYRSNIRMTLCFLPP